MIIGLIVDSTYVQASKHDIYGFYRPYFYKYMHARLIFGLTTHLIIGLIVDI
jgi:hypothetical protein